MPYVKYQKFLVFFTAVSSLLRIDGVVRAHAWLELFDFRGDVDVLSSGLASLSLYGLVVAALEPLPSAHCKHSIDSDYIAEVTLVPVLETFVFLHCHHVLFPFLKVSSSCTLLRH